MAVEDARVAIENLLSGADRPTAQGRKLAKEFWHHPLIQALQRPPKERSKAVVRPSYVPARTFVLAVLDIGAKAHLEAAPPKRHEEQTTVSLLEAINGLDNPQMRGALLTLYGAADGDVQRFRKEAEHWFDDSMERVTGWYKRHAQRVLWACALVVVVLLNVDTVQIGQTLWSNDAARAVVVAQADAAAGKTVNETKAVDAAKALPVPLGWKLFETGTGPQQIPDTAAGILAKLAGLLLSAAALTLGAPFWFDLLSKFVRVRGTGSPPARSDAEGEGAGQSAGVTVATTG